MVSTSEDVKGDKTLNDANPGNEEGELAAIAPVITAESIRAMDQSDRDQQQKMHEDVASDGQEKGVLSSSSSPKVATVGTSTEKVSDKEKTSGTSTVAKEADEVEKKQAGAIPVCIGLDANAKAVPSKSSIKEHPAVSDLTEEQVQGDSLLRQFRDDVLPLPGSDSTRQQQQATVLEDGPGAFAVSSPVEIRVDEEGGPGITSREQQQDEEDTSAWVPLNSDTPIPAIVYERHDHEQRQSGTTADQQHHYDVERQLVDAKPEEEPTWFRAHFLLLGGGLILLLLLVIFFMSLGLAGFFSPEEKGTDAYPGDSNSNTIHIGKPSNSSAAVTSNSSSPPEATTQTPEFLSLLEEVHNRGFLTCFFLPIPPYIFMDNQTGEVLGFNSAWCRAVAAAIFGAANSTTVQYVPYVPYVTNVNIQNNTADLNTWGMPPFMNRLVYSPLDHVGRYFSSPVFHPGLVVGGDPFHVQHCVEDNNFKHVDECSDLRVCVSKGLHQERFALAVLPERRLIRTFSFLETLHLFANGTCNIHMEPAYGNAFPLKVLKDNGYQGNYTIGDKLYGVSSMSIVTKDGDPRWADFVNAVFNSILVAAQHGIGQTSADEMPQTYVFGETFKDMFRHAVRAVGNYGNIFEQYFGPNWADNGGTNRIHTGHDGDNDTTGLLMSLPFGELPTIPIERSLGPTLNSILNRGYVRCGVHFDRPGFGAMDAATSTISGMDVDFCKAIAAALFAGDASAVELVTVSNQGEGFQKLAVSQEIDVLAGATWNLTNDVKEPTTGIGFAFSQPYFYGYSKDEDNLCLATLEDDHDWSVFVYWTVAATIYAEERGIQKINQSEMPLNYCFGESLGRMLRDAIFMVGNYGEIYERNLQEIIPRSGRNRLNQFPHQGPRHYPMPGIID